MYFGWSSFLYKTPFGQKVDFSKNEGVGKTKIEVSCSKTKKTSNSTFCRADFALPADRIIKVPNFSFESQ